MAIFGPNILIFWGRSKTLVPTCQKAPVAPGLCRFLGRAWHGMNQKGKDMAKKWPTVRIFGLKLAVFRPIIQIFGKSVFFWKSLPAPVCNTVCCAPQARMLRLRAGYKHCNGCSCFFLIKFNWFWRCRFVTWCRLPDLKYYRTRNVETYIYIQGLAKKWLSECCWSQNYQHSAWPNFFHGHELGAFML